MHWLWRYRIDHVIFWVTTVVFHMFTRLYLVDEAGVGQFLLEILVRNALLAGCIYINLLVLIPAFAQKKKWIVYLVFLSMDFVCYVLSKNAHDVYLYGYVLDDADKQNFWYNTFYNFSIAVFYMAFGVALQLSREWYAQRELIRKIEVEKLNTELEYLRAQINPHFLFNSINTIYFQIDRSNSAARDTLAAFSEMLRYQLYECNGHAVPVEKEIAYLKHYVDLQRIRRDANYAITFSHENTNGFSVAPLLFIPFVENAFKHVSHFSSGNEVHISMTKEEDRFRLAVVNTRDPSQPSSGPSHGIGLRNARRRLELLYNGRHTLTIQERPRHFEVNLELTINNHEDQLPHRG